MDGIDPVEFELICRMIQPKSNDRITIDGVLSSPVFWKKEKILRFLSEVSDRLEREELDAPILNYLEKYRAIICGEGTSLVNAFGQDKLQLTKLDKIGNLECRQFCRRICVDLERMETKSATYSALSETNVIINEILRKARWQS